MTAIMARHAITPTTPPAMAPALLEVAGVGIGVGAADRVVAAVGAGVRVSDVDVTVEGDVVLLEVVKVLDDGKGNSLELRVVVRPIKLDVAVAVGVGAVVVRTVAELATGFVTNDVPVAGVAAAVASGYPFEAQ
jgi:hypothetical protein